MLATLAEEARVLRALFPQPLVQRFLSAVPALTSAGRRVVYRSQDKERFLSAEAFAALPAQDAAEFERLDLEEETFFTVHWGSPLSYARPLAVLADAGFALEADTKVLDFGYGYATHLRLLAMLERLGDGARAERALPHLQPLPAAQRAGGEVCALVRLPQSLQRRPVWRRGLRGLEPR